MLLKLITFAVKVGALKQFGKNSTLRIFPGLPSYFVSLLRAIIGPSLRARSLPGQRAEAAVGVAVLNRMLHAGRPNSVRNPSMAS